MTDPRTELVGRGYDAMVDTWEAWAAQIGDDPRHEWAADLAARLPEGARVLELGCGGGMAETKELAERFRLTGVDLSERQLERARRRVPNAHFVRGDLTAMDFPPAAFEAVVSFYALIHVPLPDQQALFPRIRSWLRPGGYLLAIVGSRRWTGTEHYLGADMFWDHADTDTYLHWLTTANLSPRWHRFIPEGDSGHSLILAQAS